MGEKRKSKESYVSNGWPYAINTPVKINGKVRLIRLEEGMTGIRSRTYYIDNKKQYPNCVLQTEDLTKGNHFIYRINWGENPWDIVDIIISEDEVPYLLNKEVQPKWRNPILKDI
jgi:hypothetical protein